MMTNENAACVMVHFCFHYTGGDQCDSEFDLSDPSTWSNPLIQSHKKMLLSSSPSQKVLPNYPTSGKIAFNPKNFKNTKTGDHRTWLLYSTSLFCFSCCLFATNIQTTSSNPWGNYGKGRIGFRDFVHQSQGLHFHDVR